MKRLALVLLLSGCGLASVPEPPPALAEVPIALTTCPPKVSAPVPPPRILTTARLQDAYHALDLALQGSDHRGDVCAERLQELNRWIKTNR